MARQGYVRTAAGRLAALVLEVALFLTVWGLLVPVTEAGCPQPGYFYHQPSRLCYKAFNDTATYNGAVSRCSSDGGTLAMPRDSTTNNFLIYLKNFIDKNAWFRFGLTDVHQEGVWMWDDNVPLGDFRPWATGEPSNIGNGENCAEYYPDMYSNSWNDGPCNLAEDRKFICQASPSGVNLALGKPAYQTSSDAPADRAVDGNTDGDFFAQPGTCTHTVDGGETDPSWWVDLGQSYMVDRVVIFNRIECCSGRLNPFNIHIGDSDQVSENPKCGGDHQINVNRPSISVSCLGMKGRYVGVRLPGFHRILTLCEVLVFSDNCEEESYSVDNEAGQVTFPRAYGGSFSYSAEHCNEGNDKPLASRFCRITQNGAAVWDQPVLLMCDTDLQNLSQIVVNNETALSVATELQLITTQAETLSSSEVNSITDTLQEIVNASATEQIGDSLLTTVDNLINVNATVLQQSQEERRGPTRAVLALETFADTVILTTDTYTAVRPGVALQAADISPKELDKGQGFAFFSSGNNSTSLTEGDVTSFTTEDGGDILQTADVSIALPPNISNMIQINNTSEVRLSYTLYSSSSLFVQTSQRAARPYQHAMGTRIIGGRIAGMPVKNLPEPVIIIFTPIQSFLPEDVKEVTCVFWDFEAEAGQGAWSTEGCDNMPGQTKGRYTCACNHLTNFAMLFDVYGVGFGDHGKPLEAISIVGCVVSIICLVLTIILLAFIVTRLDKRRTRTGHAKSQLLILINLCVALLATLVIFLAGINRTASPIGCKVVAALLHYFLLAALMWMAVEAVNVYRAVVHVFDYVSGNFIIKAGAVAWGLPLVATLSTVGPSSLYRYRMDKSCWLASEPLIYAFLIPAGLILLFNLLVFILVMRKLVLEEKAQKELRGADAIEVNRQWITRQIRRACSIMALFGLTWVFGFFVIADGRHVVFAYLFCIFNTLQGLFIFIFHCVMREDMKEWRKKLTCWENLVCIGKKEVYEVNKSKSSAQVSQLVELRPLSPGNEPNPDVVM
ncbi:PREDICTED: adhesion G-protein coupled receptor G7-like [Branchiostoma belcheri]|uniref:Adhesion G-protein coupled receptor G7-like n=1 Tax=Branchiostoma belcheri TaxID=7741 RepID=A0A6P4Y7F8_BRABE|nr:PREDICTED: adhesion G-protein coupled receptor G7-like [Branchiostoma belcheri]